MFCRGQNLEAARIHFGALTFKKGLPPDLSGGKGGYGLDYAQQYRNVPYIGVLKPEVYAAK
ncbi:hypothetical protein [Dysosmobacter sp. Sow4_B12]|uniref:hypothetical protein n=1 Tax=Dysosmobacter sp. Sow4_B12 TaxID=3438777 RepID=UPI003F8FE1D4